MGNSSAIMCYLNLSFMKAKTFRPTIIPAPALQLLTFICALNLFACEQGTDQKTLKGSIEEANAMWMDAIAQKNVDAVAALYTDDALLLPPNMGAIQGKEGVRNFFSGAMESGIKKIRLVTEEVDGEDEIAIEKGTYEMMVDGDVVVDQGKYLVHWKKRDGKWMFHRDMFNSNRPTSAAAPFAKGNMLSLHLANVKLKPGVTPERFMEFFNTTVIPEFGKHWPDVKVFTAKAIRGQHKNNIGVIYYFESEDARNKYFSEDGAPTSDGLAMLEKMQPTLDRLEKDYGANNSADGTAYTDWIVQ